ncbi:hypothetical protein ACWT_3601 [Actinoplanes sp. SE50]|uniref:hypothetical protein n=1 Tax=unclassified Actinoplanes TaxID=2626549 RepID=UPI00023EC2B0|nr:MULTISPECIES: hypothetical protein [unclassified Actinoplanes]AEV84624.1 hypothetical protein ACPL_3729 [Actinoplanes sp. SE50/110]ATO83016.1 hypothetical protein ACWT_3601 [Actinoplanes sp. SE50]SLM00424.1 hypothetical protein ACSP50_3656 [Actinoplanes sp. SE50/110]
MSVLPILVLLSGLVACGVLLTLLMRRGPRQPAAAPGDIPRAIARRTAVLRWTGVTLGVIVGVVAARSGDLGTGLLMAAPLFGLCTLIGVLAGELTIRPPHGPTRTAAVEVRRIRDYLPRHLSRVVAAAGGGLLVLLTATTAAGGPDDMGRPGRSLTRQCTSDTVESHGPWPGLFYTWPLLVVVLVGLLMGYLAVRTIVRRPRSGSTGDLAVDDALRRRAARVVTGAVGVLIAIPLAGVSLIAAGGLLDISCAPTWWTITGWALLAVVPASLAMVTWCAVALVTPLDRADPLVGAR